MVPHAPITQPTNMPTVTDKPSAPRWWTWRHTILTAVLLADVVYIVAISSGLHWSNQDRLIAPQLSQIIVACLAVATIVSERVVSRARDRTRQDDQFIILSAEYADLKSELVKIRERRERDEPTVPLRHSSQRVFRASAVVTAVHASDHDDETLVSRIEDRVVQRVQGHIEEARQQGHWSGYSACAKDGLAGIGAEAASLPAARNSRS